MLVSWIIIKQMDAKNINMAHCNSKEKHSKINMKNTNEK